ncbi:MAG TPA: hypothetical protein VIC00_03855 [Candidatus Acidoferrales bacterium]|jgi:hypothetical protein
MGRTVPTFVQVIQQAGARWTKFRRALRREDQPFFDRLFRRARCYTQAATYQCHDNPMEAILLSIALDQEKRIDALEHALGQKPEELHETPGLDFRPLSLAAGDEAVADYSGADAPSSD